MRTAANSIGRPPVLGGGHSEGQWAGRDDSFINLLFNTLSLIEPKYVCVLLLLIYFV